MSVRFKYRSLFEFPEFVMLRYEASIVLQEGSQNNRENAERSFVPQDDK